MIEGSDSIEYLQKNNIHARLYLSALCNTKFSPTWPSGPSWSSSRDVRLVVCLSQESQEGPQTETCLEAPSQSILQPQTESELNLKIYSCLRCGKDNKTENELESHMEAIHVFDPPEWHNCILCGKNPLTEASLKTHISEIHGQHLVKTKHQPEPEAEVSGTCLPVCLEASKNPNPQHNCRKCGKALSQICPCNIEPN